MNFDITIVGHQYMYITTASLITDIDQVLQHKSSLLSTDYNDFHGYTFITEVKDDDC